MKVCAHFEGLVYIASNQSVHMLLAFQGEVTGQHSGQGFPNSIWSAGDFGTLALSHACSKLFFNVENSLSMLTTKQQLMAKSTEYLTNCVFAFIVGDNDFCEAQQ